MKSFRRSDLDSPVTRISATPVARVSPQRHQNDPARSWSRSAPWTIRQYLLLELQYSPATNRLFITFLTTYPLLTNGQA